MKKWSRVSKKTIYSTLIIELFVVVAIVFTIIHDSYANAFGQKTIACVVLLLCAGVLIPIALSPLLEISFQQLENFAASKEYVRQHLAKEYCVEVVPIKVEPQHEYFLTKELCKRAKFYAKIMDDDTILILIKFNGENEEAYYEDIPSKFFETYYKVV